jgi:hypothetical protein
MKTEITIEKTSAKGAMLITDGMKSAWIMPKMKRADGSFTPGAYAALEKAKTKEEFIAEKKSEREAEVASRTLNGHTYRVWSPSDEYTRLYFSDGTFIGISIKETSPHGYYERHRYCKGERSTISFARAESGLAKECLPFLQGVMVQDGENWIKQ